MTKPRSDELVSVTLAMKPDPPGEDTWPYPPGLAALSAARDRVVEAARFERKLERITTEEPSRLFTPKERTDLLAKWRIAQQERQAAVDALEAGESKEDGDAEEHARLVAEQLARFAR